MKKKVFLTKDMIFKAQDIETVELQIPEWGGAVFVRGMTGHERDKYESSLYQQRGKNQQLNLRNARTKMVVLCTVDQEGKRIFDDKEIGRLSQKSARAIDRIFDLARELSGMTDEDIDELTKNSEEANFDDSW